MKVEGKTGIGYTRGALDDYIACVGGADQVIGDVELMEDMFSKSDKDVVDYLLLVALEAKRQNRELRASQIDLSFEVA